MLKKLLALLLFVSASAQGSDVAEPPGLAYEVVLGSYVDRNIALRELTGFSACKQPLIVLPYDAASGPMFRVVDGPYETFADADIVRAKWLECQIDDAWVNQRQIQP